MSADAGGVLLKKSFAEAKQPLTVHIDKICVLVGQDNIKLPLIRAASYHPSVAGGFGDDFAFFNFFAVGTRQMTTGESMLSSVKEADQEFWKSRTGQRILACPSLKAPAL